MTRGPGPVPVSPTPRGQWLFLPPWMSYPIQLWVDLSDRRKIHGSLPAKVPSFERDVLASRVGEKLLELRIFLNCSRDIPAVHGRGRPPTGRVVVGSEVGITLGHTDSPLLIEVGLYPPRYLYGLVMSETIPKSAGTH